jgi:hypothetical protein
MSEPVATCFKCGKEPHEIQEYIDGVDAWDAEESEDAPHTPLDYMLLEESTYNRKTKHFACTDCYIAIGCPSGRDGWVAP